MIRRLIKIVNKEWQGMHQGAILLGAFSLLSQLLGLFRDRMLAHTLGPSTTLDVYYAAFQIPDLIYLSIASLASITVLMPFLVERLGAQGGAEARRFFNDILSGFVLLLVLVSGVVFLLMPKLAPIIAPGFGPEEQHLLIGTSRIMLLSPIFMGLSNMLGTITQLLRKFFVFSLSPIFYNIGIIIGIVFLYPSFGAYGLAAGVAIGAMLHMAVQLPPVIKAGFAPKLSARLERSSLRQVAMLSLPRTLGMSMNSIAILVIVALGSVVGEGSISIFKLSFNLQSVPVSIIGISYAVAVFPTLTQAFSKKDMREWKGGILAAMRQIVFWSLPLAALFIVLRAQIVRVVLGSGAFSWSDTRLAAAALALFALSLIAQNIILVSVRGFYSAQNTKTPLYINAICSAGIVGLAFLFLHLFKSMPEVRYFFESLLRVEDTPGTAVLMLPLAYSIGTIANAWLHWKDLKALYMQGSTGLGRTLFESTAAAFGAGTVAYLSLNALAPIFDLATFWGVFLQGAIAGTMGILAAAVILLLLGSEPFYALITALRNKFWKVDLVEPGQ